LDLFKESNLNGKFYWTGGTMLSFVYLKHRLSVDLDFFSGTSFNYDDVIGFINDLKFVLKLSKEYWTQDKILQKWKFTNVYREVDRTTQYIINNIIKPHKNDENQKQLLFNLILFRIFNRIETWQNIGEYQQLDKFDIKLLQIMLNEMWEKNIPIFTNAFMVTGVKFLNSDKKFENYLFVIEQIYKKIDWLYNIVSNCSGDIVHKKITEMDGIGKFLAHVIMSDLVYTKMVRFDDEQWCGYGNGCMKGLKLIFSYMKKTQYLQALKKIRDEQDLHFQRLNLDFKKWR